MKKEHNYRTLSHAKCTKCGKRLKLRVSEAKAPHNSRKCYKCYEAIRYDLDVYTGDENITRRCVASHKTAVR